MAGRKKRNGKDLEPKTRVEKQAARRQSGRVVKIPPVKTPPRHVKNLEKWLKWYLPGTFHKPFSADHRKVIRKIEQAVLVGGLFAVAMPRGFGKTSLIKAATLWAVMNGHRQYVVPIGAEQKAARAILNFCKIRLRFTDRLMDSYPHLCAPIKALEGKAIKAVTQIQEYGHESTHIVYEVEKLVLPTIKNARGKVLTGCGAVIECRSLTGNIRGMTHTPPAGQEMRPDFVIPDDPQTRESAKSPKQTEDREAIIRGDVLGLAGHDRKIAAVMPCTVIWRNDLADRFLDHARNPEWQGEKTAAIYRWPDAQDTLWAEYAKIYTENPHDSSECQRRATAFYRRHRKEMDAGARVAWKHMFNDGEISALQHAENLLIERKEPAFYAEYMNDPKAALTTLYELEAEHVMQSVNHIKRGVVPDACQVIVAFADVNYAGLHWTVTAFENDMTAAVVWYGKWPETGVLVERNATELERNQAIYNGLIQWANIVYGLPLYRGEERCALNLAMVDRGFAPEVVQRFCKAARFGFPFMPSRGYGSSKYNPAGKNLIGQPREHCHLTRSDLGQYLAHNADYWRETAQRAFLGYVGAPGSASVFGSKPLAHRDFAEHMAGEILTDKVEGQTGPLYRWAHKPGQSWDWLDATVGTYVGAAWIGLSPSGRRVTRPKRRPRRRPKVEIET
jgi:hypothetical protein